MKGAVISSTATPDKNTLSTGSLTYSDIQNKADYNSSSIGVNYATGADVAKKDQGLIPNIGVTASGNADSTTKSAISPGTIEVRSNPNQDISKLSRDPSGSLNALGKIFDKETVVEQQELANLFGQEAFKAIGDLGLKEGSPEKVALDTFAGGLMAKLGGGSFASGAASGGITQLVMNELANIKDPAVLQWASAIVGAAAAKLAGGNAQTGASVAASETKNNYLTHEQYRKMLEELDQVDKSDKSPEEKEKAKADIKAEYEKIDKEQNQKWENENKVDIIARFDVNGNLELDGFRFEKVGVNLDGTDAYLCAGVSSITLNGRKGYTYEEAKEYVKGFGKGIKNKVDDVSKFLMTSDPKQLDAMIASIPGQLQVAWNEGLANTAVNVGGKVYQITLEDWKKQYDALQTITDPEERGTKTAELLVDIGSTFAAVRAAGKAVTSFADFGGTVTKESSKGVDIFAGKIKASEIPNMSKGEILEKLPKDWTYTENNGFVHVRDANGTIRMRIDPPDKATNYDHVHLFDESKNPIDIELNIVDRKSPDAHIPYQK